MLFRWLAELVSSATLLDTQNEAGTMAYGAGSVMRAFASLLTLQTVLGAPSAPILHAGQRGAVASESDICSHIGIELLRLGGNAADAMVGTVACVGVVGMYHSGTTARHSNITSIFTDNM
jgi:gamma-glutamyltranspeptidase/glutathione hydrolase